jgi:hypothetical protein
MKARAKQKRFFRKPVQPNICVLEKIEERTTNEHEWTEIIDQLIKTGVDRAALIHDLTLFSEADNFGSLLRPRLRSSEVQAVLEALHNYDQSVQIPTFEYYETLSIIKQALKQADYLSPKYHVVIANPPYMGGKGMNGRMSVWVKDNYPDSKSDLFAMFIERGFDLLHYQGYSAMVTMQSWMFLSSYEKLRIRLLNEVTIECMAHMGNMVMGIAFGTSATVWCKSLKPEYRGAFCYVDYEDIGEGNKPVTFPPLNARNKSASK